jgi:hypothetical protein
MIRKLVGWMGGKRASKDSLLKVGGIFGKMTPEAMCDIDPKNMDRSEIRSRLAMLYQRHNQAAGSLNPELREEAEYMLQAIVHCRTKYIDEPAAAAK